MNPMRWWRSSDDLTRVVVYTRTSMLPLVAVGPFILVAAAGTQVGEISPGPLVALVAVVVAVSLIVLYVLDGQIMGRPLSRRDVGLWVGSVVVATVAIVVLPAGDVRGPGLVMIGAFAIAPLGGFGARWYVPAGLVVALAIALQSDVRDQPSRVASLTFQMLWIFLAVAWAVQASLWLVKVVRRLADADRTRAELAVAEERLRFARDLHDIVGRDLSAIAVTSDLVAELARRGRPEAAERAEEVRTIAQESLRQVRAAVRGYRAIDLRVELEGSAALLRSAGVTSRVTAQIGELPDDVRTAAAWVVREGVTNVVRHSAATVCRIEVREDDGVVRVRMENDGARGPIGTGSGLTGLTERLRPLGGALSFSQADGVFVLEASVPVTVGVPA
ncbi:sensor histidine kinase [Cryptosporangium phraense]|uniref:Sensor histidine kinase n=1 Tax=Cryptosporangium phraense TaxID=2593070 RepID=A0A545AKP2_9ACTN|nr:sensor histidine kinase [Cryptosporangium phraense]TQS41884.1 sensor histidine kinase [Cryptosporangium phraense]